MTKNSFLSKEVKMMSNTIKKFNNFATALNKAKIESNKPEHPPEETIHLYAMNAFPEAKMQELAEHFEYCWLCGDILADAIEFQQISEDVEAGRVTANVKLPSFEELKKMAFGETVASSGKNEWQDWANALLEELKAFFAPPKGKEILARGLLPNQTLRRIKLTLPNNLSEEIVINYDNKEKRLEIFSDNKGLEGKTVRITKADGNFLQAVFRNKPFKVKSEPFNAVFNNINPPDIEDCKIEIV